jgi:predicted  nucleic acid-binding Zn-ribbon protein
METAEELNDEQLEKMIERLEDRIDTTRDLLSDADDENTLMVLQERLNLYEQQLRQCEDERNKRK